MAEKGVAIPYTKVKHPHKGPLKFINQVETLSHTKLKEKRALPWSPFKGLPIVSEQGRSTFGKWGRSKKGSRKARDMYSTPRTNIHQDCLDNGFLLAQEIGQGSTAKVRVAQASIDRQKAMKDFGVVDTLVFQAKVPQVNVHSI